MKSTLPAQSRKNLLGLAFLVAALIGSTVISAELRKNQDSKSGMTALILGFSLPITSRQFFQF